MPSANYIFASYANRDLEAVEPILKALGDEFGSRGLAVYVWFNQNDLQPGQDWEAALTRGLRECIGLLLFVSNNSIASAWVRNELLFAVEKPDNLIIPILLESVPQLPTELDSHRIYDLREAEDPNSRQVKLRSVVNQIADSVAEYLESESISPVVPASEAPALAATLAEQTREVQNKKIPEASAAQSVFVVHGHDQETLDEINSYLKGLGIKPVVLAKIAGPAQSLFQKFVKYSLEARFAIVIITFDDFGASLRQYEGAGAGVSALQFRARQNVILELGFFYGQLGFENVFVLYRHAKAFPNFERPSDLEGIVFVEIDQDGQWQEVLKDNLDAAGFQTNTSE